jgi:hypothetical protein
VLRWSAASGKEGRLSLFGRWKKNRIIERTMRSIKADNSKGELREKFLRLVKSREGWMSIFRKPLRWEWH